jgi:hypothetical protein
MAPRISRVHVGARVEGNHGGFIANPRGFKRRVRSCIMGTVLSAEGSSRWIVRFDFDGSTKICHSNSLTLLAATPGAGIPLDEAAEFIMPGLQNVSVSTEGTEDSVDGVVSFYFIYFIFYTLRYCSSNHILPLLLLIAVIMLLGGGSYHHHLC